jgi:hypothetical protein
VQTWGFEDGDFPLSQLAHCTARRDGMQRGTRLSIASESV